MPGCCPILMTCFLANYAGIKFISVSHKHVICLLSKVISTIISPDLELAGSAFNVGRPLPATGSLKNTGRCFAVTGRMTFPPTSKTAVTVWTVLAEMSWLMANKTGVGNIIATSISWFSNCSILGPRPCGPPPPMGKRLHSRLMIKVHISQ